MSQSGSERKATPEQLEIATLLLELGAVSVSPNEPFTWTSGLKSPIYCDNRLIISTVDQRRRVARGFVDLMKQNDWQPDLVAGTATAGIPHGAWVADRLDLPMVYVRSAEKKHGKKNLIEGRVPDGASVVVVEDLISTGGSCIKAAQALEEQGAKVLGVVAIFQYGLPKAAAGFAEANLNYSTLTNMSALLDVAIESGRLSAGDRASLVAWQEDPAAWSVRHGGA
ncbi:Orotate phosphoribosyltransferase [Sulfidibacter corallicola]|uniref:Orotate phosphoribosyltransferase n=1 Tax=Sulfidibacter corallicola TaxID=2818388 RepID=A0A8A4TCT1_SULCO|nr:orotate phosphoribosyltransferase [Sulfidibacter corallicola]QTD47746.1 orotate phosphoribosyltransferase [Sulfidibacter corallicola]